MTPNELLLWLSARKEGSWPQFRGAIDRLELANSDGEAEQDTPLPLHQRIRFNLERLGHVEFDAAECEDGWRVVPPTLSLSQHNNRCHRRSVRCSDSQARRKHSAGSGTDYLFSRYRTQIAPDIIRMQAPEADILIELAEREGLLCQLDTPTALLSHLPSVDTVKGWRREALPSAGKEWEVKQFIIERRAIKWRTITLQEANAPDAQGLFCFTRYQSPQYFLREGRRNDEIAGGGWKVPNSIPPEAPGVEI